LFIAGFWDDWISTKNGISPRAPVRKIVEFSDLRTVRDHIPTCHISTESLDESNPRGHPMSHILTFAIASRVPGLIDDVGFWWSTATPNDFGLMAITVIVTVWFVSRYYLD
jgi:hypothetical protein